jgi:uncharacterized protein YoxC
MIEKLVIQKLTIAGKKYEYPDTTALVGKINELVDAVNKQEEQIKLLIDALERLAKSQQEMNTEITALFIK